MRLILMALLSLPVIIYAQADKKPAVFGKVDKADLELKTCDFDPEAEAMVLMSEAYFLCDLRGDVLYTELTHHVRIKILKDKGLEKANIKIRYRDYRNSQGVNSLAANTYNLDPSGTISTTKLEKKLVYTKRINSRYTEQTFAMPQAKAGSIIEYKYSIRGADLEDWHMQGSLPTKLSRYTLDYPPFFEVHCLPICTFPVDMKTSSTRIRNTKTFTMENVVGFRDENHITCEDDYLQKIESRFVAVNINNRRHPLLRTWKEIVKDLTLDEDFGVQLKKDIPRTTDLDAELKNISDTLKRMVAIHNYVKKNMGWDGNDNIWAINGVKSAWKDKVGTSGEINLILINLLRDAGVKVSPLLVSTHQHGRINAMYPDTYLFNKVLAMVNIGSKTYILDGTDKYTSSYLIPEDVMYSRGLLINSIENFNWIDIWDPSKINKNTVVYHAEIDGQGRIKGHTSIHSADYARTKRASSCGDREKFINSYLKSSQPTATIDSLELDNLETDSLPLVQRFKFDMPLNESGDYCYFSPHLFSAVNSNPFLADNRFSDVFFGTNQAHTVIANIRIPDGYVFEELPKNMRITMEDKSLTVTRLLSVSGNLLNARISVDCNRPFYSVDEYAIIQEFYKKMYSLLDEQIVIKKKNS